MINELKVQFNKRISLTPCDVYSEPSGPTLTLINCPGSVGDADFSVGTYKITNGCPPFELWVDEDTYVKEKNVSRTFSHLCRIYASACGGNTQDIKIKDGIGRWSNVIEITGEATCDCSGTINYTTLQMQINQTQSLTVTGETGSDCTGGYTWELSGGTGTLSPLTGTSTTYTAPANNADCSNNPTIKLYCCDVLMDTITIAVNVVTGCVNTLEGGIAYNKCYDCTFSPTGHCITFYRCDGSRVLIGDGCCAYGSSVHCNNCPGAEGWFSSYCCTTGWGTCAANGPWGDIRTPEAIAVGCCPEWVL